MTHRYRVLAYAAAAIGLAWLIALGAYWVADRIKVTPERVTAYVDSLKWSELSAEERARALEKLAAMLNALSFEDRREVRFGSQLEELFLRMTDAERERFVEATLPRGVQQMLTAFEELPEDKRQRAVRESLQRMQNARREIYSGRVAPTNAPPFDEEFQRKVTAMGLKAFYSEASAQTKAELAPVLEEMQRLMESGRLLYDRRGPRR